MQIFTILPAVGFLLLFIIAAARFRPSLIKLKKHQALVRSRAIDLPVFGGKGVHVFFKNTHVFPVFDVCEIMDLNVKRFEVILEGRDGALFRDKVTADISVSFALSIPREQSAVVLVAEKVGAEEVAKPGVLEELFLPTFSAAIKSACNKYDFEYFQSNRGEATEALLNEIGFDLMGFQLESIDLGKLEKNNYEPIRR